jgi:hypothetical protein
MYRYHRYDFHTCHWKTFYKHSIFSEPVHLQLDWKTFDASSFLGVPNANLLYVTGHCFWCKFAVHETKHCLQPVHKELFCKRFMNDPHSELGFYCRYLSSDHPLVFDDDCPGLVWSGPAPMKSHGVRGHPSVSLPPLSSICFPLVHMYFPYSLLHYLQGPYLKPTTSRPDSLTTFQKSTHR